MSFSLITTVWGIPVAGTAAAGQNMSDAVLNLAKEMPIPPDADIFLQMPPPTLQRLASQHQLSGAASFFAPTGSGGYSDEWSLPVSIDIVRPPKPSGQISLIGPDESAESYIRRVFPILFEGVAAEKKYGFSMSLRQKMIGDLWFVLDQTAKAKMETDVFWSLLFAELIWGDILEKPSNRDMAQAVLEDVIVWLKRFCPDSQKMAVIFGAALQEPLGHKNYRGTFNCLLGLKKIVPNFFADPFFTREVALGAVKTALSDNRFDYAERWEAMESFLHETGEQIRNPLSIKDAWLAAYYDAWIAADEKAILRLEEVADHKRWSNKLDHTESCTTFQIAAFDKAIRMLEGEPFDIHPFFKMVLMLSSGPLNRFEKVFHIRFLHCADVDWTNISAYSQFLLALWKESTNGNLSRAPSLVTHFDTYRRAIFEKLKENLQRTIPPAMTRKNRLLLEIRRGLERADHVWQESGQRSDGYFDAAYLLVRKTLGPTLKTLLEDSTLTFGQRREMWQNYKENYRDATDLSPETDAKQLALTMAQDKVDVLFKNDLSRTIGEKLRALILHLTLFIPEMVAKKIFWFQICRHLKMTLFENQDDLQRSALIANVLNQGGHFNWLAEDAKPADYPWVNLTGGLQEPNRYKDRAYMERSLEIARILDGETYFLPMLKKTVIDEISVAEQPEKKRILSDLLRTDEVVLQKMLLEIQQELDITLP